MERKQVGEQIVARIGFAERWLGRAKAQVAGGNMTRGALTLVLADAEVRHAIEVAGMRSGRGTFRHAAAGAAVALALLAAAGTTIVVAPQGREPAVPSADAAPPVVTLAAHSGSLLSLIPAPLPASVDTSSASSPAPRVLRSTPAQKPAVPSPGALQTQTTPVRSVSTPAPSSAVSPPAPAVLLAPPALPAAAPVPPANVQAAPLELTAGDLIDMVLAAERALRGDRR